MRHTIAISPAISRTWTLLVCPDAAEITDTASRYSFLPVDGLGVSGEVQASKSINNLILGMPSGNRSS